MLNFSFFGLFVIVTLHVCTNATPFDDEVAEKQYANSLHLKRANTVPFFGLGKRAPFSQYHMGLGKRSDEANDAEINNNIYYRIPENNFDSQKRYDINQFHMGFGKRSMTDQMKRFSSNQFHMGLGKKFDVTFPEKKSFHMGLGKRSFESFQIVE